MAGRRRSRRAARGASDPTVRRTGGSQDERRDGRDAPGPTGGSWGEQPPRCAAAIAVPWSATAVELPRGAPWRAPSGGAGGERCGPGAGWLAPSGGAGGERRPEWTAPPSALVEDHAPHAPRPQVRPDGRAHRLDRHLRRVDRPAQPLHHVALERLAVGRRREEDGEPLDRPL